jgi:hypothetical protein
VVRTWWSYGDEDLLILMEERVKELAFVLLLGATSLTSARRVSKFGTISVEDEHDPEDDQTKQPTSDDRRR